MATSPSSPTHHLQPSTHTAHRRRLTHGEEQLADVVAVERGALRRQPGREVCDAHVHHALVGVDLSRLGGLDVAARFGCQVHHHRARLHRLYVLLSAVRGIGRRVKSGCGAGHGRAHWGD